MRLASTIWWKSSTGTSSSGFGALPADAARHIDQHVDRAAGAATTASTDALSVTSTLAARIEPAGLAGPASVSTSSTSRSQAMTVAAILGERDRDGLADAARGAGHDHALAFET